MLQCQPQITKVSAYFHENIPIVLQVVFSCYSCMYGKVTHSNVSVLYVCFLLWHMYSVIVQEYSFLLLVTRQSDRK